MLSFLPAWLRGFIAGLFLLINTLLLAPLLICVSLLRFVIPVQAWQRGCTATAIAIAELWISINSLWMKLTQKMQWQVDGVEQLDKQHWYLVTSNHQSYADIFILQHLLNRKIPMLKFFLKQQLIWVPVIGLCWWAKNSSIRRLLYSIFWKALVSRRLSNRTSSHRINGY
ncbi:MAG: 1-acyl-sn-glycerol-3-phosphate acyltransferase [Halioglobus sp.]